MGRIMYKLSYCLALCLFRNLRRNEWAYVGNELSVPEQFDEKNYINMAMIICALDKTQ